MKRVILPVSLRLSYWCNLPFCNVFPTKFIQCRMSAWIIGLHEPASEPFFYVINVGQAILIETATFLGSRVNRCSPCLHPITRDLEKHVKYKFATKPIVEQDVNRRILRGEQWLLRCYVINVVYKSHRRDGCLQYGNGIDHVSDEKGIWYHCLYIKKTKKSKEEKETRFLFFLYIVTCK